MLMSNEQYGEVMQTAMRDGLSAEKAVEIADICNAWSAKHERCEDCQGGDVCTGCKDVAPQWDHKGFAAERLDDDIVRYTAKEGDDGCQMTVADFKAFHAQRISDSLIKYTKKAETLDDGLDDEGQAVLETFNQFTVLQKKAVEAATNELDALRQNTERTTKKLDFATDLLEKKEQQLKEKDREIIALSGRITQLETQLKSAARPVISYAAASQQQGQQAKPKKLAGVDPFNHDRWDFPRSPQSTEYLDETKIKTPVCGPEIIISRMPGS